MLNRLNPNLYDFYTFRMMKPSLENGLTSAQFSSESVANIIVEDHDDLEDLMLEQKINQAGVGNFLDYSLEEDVRAGSYRKPVEIQTGGYKKPEDVQSGGYVGLNSRDYVEALKRIADIEKELRGVEGQMLERKRKFAN